ITKSRFLIDKIAKFHKKYDVIIFLFIDLIFTAIIVLCYLATWDVFSTDPRFLWANFKDWLAEYSLNLPSPQSMSPAYYSLFQAFTLTTFLTLLLTTVYSVSLMLLMFFNFLGRTTYMRWLVPENMLSLIRWVLPVEALPFR